MNRTTRAVLRTFCLVVGLIASSANANLITTTVSGNLKFQYLGGEAGPSLQEFGLGTPPIGSQPNDRDVVFLIDYYLPRVQVPIVDKGYYPAGSQLDFYNLSNYNGWRFAFSSNLETSPSQSDTAAFYDTDNSLGLGGSVVQVIGENSWLLHLDDAWSFMYDDDDNELLIKVWIDLDEPTPIREPPLLLMIVSALFLLMLCCRKSDAADGLESGRRAPHKVA